MPPLDTLAKIVTWSAVSFAFLACVFAPRRARPGIICLALAATLTLVAELLDVFELAAPWRAHGAATELLTRGVMALGFVLLFWSGLVELFHYKTTSKGRRRDD